MTAILEMRGITKTFPGVRALDNVTLRVEAGEIHAICGENGAGKSTLMKVLSGVYPHGSYEGEIVYEGRPVAFRDIRDSEAMGIIIIHQELALVPLLSIAENIFLGNEVARGGVIDWPETFTRTGELLRKVGLSEPPTTAVDKLGVGKQQLVEIAKALSKRVKLLILDEPTASLQENDSRKLLDLLLEFKAQGIASIIISHKLNEIRAVADSVTVIRDGATVSTLRVAGGPVSEARIIRDMVGRDMASRYPERSVSLGETLLEVQGWSVWHPEQVGRQVIRDVAFHVRAGEVLGIAGLMGSGRTELAMSLFGRSYGRGTTGRVTLRGREIDTATVGAAIGSGLAYVTEDRKGLGLILEETIIRNTTLAALEKVAGRGVIDAGAERKAAEDFRKQLRIRTPGVFQKVMNLSGGNQQKVVLSKWLFTGPEVLILDEPTRGIDVGAKFEIYGIINDLAAAGKGVVMISSEMPELLGMCDRIHVMNEGAFVGELSRAEASQERIMEIIMQDAARSRGGEGPGAGAGPAGAALGGGRGAMQGGGRDGRQGGGQGPTGAAGADPAGFAMGEGAGPTGTAGADPAGFAMGEGAGPTGTGQADPAGFAMGGMRAPAPGDDPSALHAGDAGGPAAPESGGGPAGRETGGDPAAAGGGPAGSKAGGLTAPEAGADPTAPASGGGRAAAEAGPRTAAAGTRG